MGIRMTNIATPMPQPRAKFTNKLGLPLSGGRVYTYEPGTDIPKKTWRDVDKSVENTNPIQLDAAGEADIYGIGFYRVVVKDFFGLTIYDVEKTGIAVELDASFVVDGDKNQHEINQEQLDENTAIRSEISTVESYIVYAEKYGASLNEAMAAINTEFAGNRVRVYVPSEFPVTGTVHLDIDCDLDLSTLQVMNDVDVVFDPIFNWNGSATKCDIYCNNKSVRLGWNLYKQLGSVAIFNHTFFDAGNESLGTSADYFNAFRISVSNIKKLDLHHPALINSYVKPNAVVGDQNGTNRLLNIEGTLSGASFASDINIFMPFAENMASDEDSDGLVINLGQSSGVNSVFNIDIVGGKYLRMYRRGIKIIGHELNASGIRLSGAMEITGAGPNPWSAIDISGYVHVEWDDTVKTSGWVQDLYVWGGAWLTGKMRVIFAKNTVKIIGGNSRRGFVCEQGLTPAARKCFVDIDSIDGINGFELMRVREGQTVKLNKVKHVILDRLFTLLDSTVDINEVEFSIRDQSPAVTYPAQCVDITGGTTRIGRYVGAYNQAANIQYSIRGISTLKLTVDSAETRGKNTTSILLLNNCANTKIRKAETDAVYVALSQNGGNNLLLDQCKSSGASVFFNNVAAPLTNVVELNTLTF